MEFSPNSLQFLMGPNQGAAVVPAAAAANSDAPPGCSQPPELSCPSEGARGCTKPQAPSDPVCLQAFCSSAPSLLLYFYPGSKSISSLFFLSVTPELWHFKGSAAEVPVTDCLRRSLDWAMPPVWLLIQTSAPWALGPSCKTTGGCNAPLL